MRLSDYNVWVDEEGHCGVFNGVSGRLEVLTPAEREAVVAAVGGARPPAWTTEVLQRLVDASVIVNDGHDERALLRRRYDDSRWGHHSLGLTVVTSLGCNFDCPYCFEDKHPSRLKADVADALVDIVEQALPGIGAVDVTWMGGEPLLGRTQLLDLSDRIIDRCRDAGVHYRASIITNGWYLDADTAHALVERRVMRAQVTVDGPPRTHDARRPLVGGRPTFDRILANLDAAADIIDIHVRMNVDRTNVDATDELLRLLAEAGLADRLSVGLGRVTDAVGNPDSPLASYAPSCLGAADFAGLELDFEHRARAWGFSTPGPPRPTATPCTAVRANELVVGADGELWKCWDDIGDHSRAIGDVRRWRESNGELARWLTYHPVDDPTCSTCVALPVCMGGCAHHHFNSDDTEARCGTFRHNHAERAAALVRDAVGLRRDPRRPPRRSC